MTNNRLVVSLVLATGLLVGLVAGAGPAHAAVGERWIDPIFTTVNRTNDVTYGSAPDEFGVMQSLKLDVYTPAGDTVTDRPAVIFVHGGGFQFGDKSNGESWARFYAQRGYVAASINYRLRPAHYFDFAHLDDPVSQAGVLDAQHDAQAAVRWFRANAAGLGVDPARIVMTGSSAGGVTSLAVGMNSTDTGSSGNPGFSSHICMAVSLSGAFIPQAADPDDSPAMFFHGEADTRVPFPFAQATNVGLVGAGVPTWFNSYPGVGHGLDGAGTQADIRAKIPPVLRDQVINGSCTDPAPPPGTFFHGVTPTRIVDTRDGTGGSATPWTAGSPRSVPIAGRAGLPTTGVSAVVMNVTVVGSTAASHLTVWPDDPFIPMPTASSINFTAGQTVANLVTVPVGAAGAVRIATNTGAVHVVIDVVGWYDGTAGSRYRPVDPARIYDSRAPAPSPLGPGETRPVPIAGLGGIPNTGATAVAVTVTAVGPTAATHLTLWPDGSTVPVASTLNAPAGADVANLAIIPIGSDGAIRVRNNSGSAHVVLDVAGWFAASTDTTGDRFGAVRPERLLDSRLGVGGPATRWGAGETRTLAVTGVGGVPAHPGRPVHAVAVNLTAVGPTVATHVTAWRDGSPPVASVLNLGAGQTAAGLAIVPVAADGTIRLRNEAGAVDLVADVVGWFA